MALAPLCAALLALPGAQGTARDPGIPSSIRTVFVVEMSHLDVGFTDPPSVVESLHSDHLETALDIADSWPTFHWTIESAWMLEQFDARASAADKQRLRDRFAQGRFHLGAGYVNPHSGLWGEEELHRYVVPAERLARAYGAERSCALMDDVPGFSRAIPRVLAQSDVSFLLLGANSFIGGKPDIPLADRPFWWQGADGSRVLTWLTYTSYAEGFGDWGFWTLQSAYNKLGQRLPEYEAAGYPYDAVLVMRGFDNAGPSGGMANLAASWNAQYDNPKIVLGTPDDFFRYLLQKYGDVFPTYEGDAAGMWESVATVTPASNAEVRRSRAQLAGVEALHAALHLHVGSSYPRADLDEAWRLAMVFDEHSGGGPGWPGLMTLAEVDQQNQEYVAMAQDCATRVRSLREDALAAGGDAIIPSGEAGIAVFNPLGGPFDGVVEVDCGAPQPADLRLVDPAGGPDAVFRWTRTDRSALALRTTVPARGWRRWRAGSGGSAPPPPLFTPATSLQAGAHELVLDPLLGVATELRVAGGTNLVAQPSAHRFGGIERATNQQAFFGIWESFDRAPVTILVEEPGPVYRRARVFGPNGVLFREFVLFEDELRVDVVAHVRRAMLPYVPKDKHSHHYGVAFPANLSLPTTLEVDGPDGWFRPGRDSLPGAGLSHFGHATGARLLGAGGRWISASSATSPIVDLGEMNSAAGQSVETDEYGLTFKLIRFASETEVVGGGIHPFDAEPGMPDDTVLRCTIRIGAAGEAPPDREQMRHDVAPPLAVWVDAGAAPAQVPESGALYGVGGPAGVVSFKRSWADDGYVIKLRAGPPGGTATVTLPHAPSAAWSASLLEEPRSPLVVNGATVSVPLTPNGVATALLLD